MSQLNLRVSKEFEELLVRFMRLRRLSSKSQAIRVAVAEGVARIEDPPQADFHAWIGAALESPLNPEPRFPTHDSLWLSTPR